MKKIFFVMVLFASISLSQEQWSQTVTWIRPANHTTYTAGDAVQDSNSLFMILPNASAYNGLPGTIQSVYFAMDTANVANGTFTLYLFNDTVGIKSSVVGDNVAQPLTAAMAKKIVGYVSFTLVTGGAASTLANAYVTPALRYTTNTDTKLYGILTATGAYVPKDKGTITLRFTFTK